MVTWRKGGAVLVKLFWRPIDSHHARHWAFSAHSLTLTELGGFSILTTDSSLVLATIIKGFSHLNDQNNVASAYSQQPIQVPK